MSSSTAKSLDQIWQSAKDIAQRNGMGNDVQTVSSIALDLGARLAGGATTPPGTGLQGSATVSGGASIRVKVDLQTNYHMISVKQPKPLNLKVLALQKYS